MKPPPFPYGCRFLPNQLTRRDFALRIAAGGATLASTVPWWLPTAAAAARVPAKIVLINEPFLRQEYPNDIAALLAAIYRFAEQQNGEVLNTGRSPTPSDIKIQLQ